MIKDGELKKSYNRKANANIVSIRLSEQEKVLLGEAMHREGWSCTSRFMRSRLFGDNPDRGIRKLIDDGDAWNLEYLLIEEVRALARKYDYIKDEYSRARRELLRSGADVRRFEEKTNSTYRKYVSANREVFRCLQQIAERLGIRSYFEENSRAEEWNGYELEMQAIVEGRETPFDSDMI